MEKVGASSYLHVMQCYFMTGMIVYDTISGEFGVVYKGYLTGQQTDEVVAIKTLKGKIILIK